MLSIKDYPDATRAGLIDNILRLPHELVLTESFAPADRQVARERIDLAIRRLRSADEEAGAERREMLAARDALGAGQAGFGDHHLSLLVRADDLAALDAAMAAAGPRSPTSAPSRCARTSISSPVSGASSPATKPIWCAAR